jgi:hypothetical protein
MIREKDVVKADFSVLIIMCFESLGRRGGSLSELRLESRSPIKLSLVGLYVW